MIVVFLSNWKCHNCSAIRKDSHTNSAMMASISEFDFAPAICHTGFGIFGKDFFSASSIGFSFGPALDRSLLCFASFLTSCAAFLPPASVSTITSPY